MPKHRLVPTARSVAADVLARVQRDGAFAAAALDAELDRNLQLEPRDRALATELVYGTLRLQRWLEARLVRYAPRGLDGLDPEVRATLAIAAYQILALERVPAFAAVSEAVTIARAVSGERVSGFVNAVLRKVTKERRPTAEELAKAALESADPAVAKAIVDSVGESAALSLLAASEPPPLGIRVEDASERDVWIARLREARPSATIEAGRVSPHAILVRGAGKLADLPGFGEGAWTSQEEGSQVVALALGARPGDVVLDACAGRGNKTGLLARAVAPGGAVDAVDLHPNKLLRLERELARISASVRATYAVDWAAGAGGITETYDRILIDAPCSGTGTIRRRPELLLRRAVADIAELAELQRAILARVAPLLRPGGRLVYAVCSVLREEAEAVVATAQEHGLVPAAFDAPIAAFVADAANDANRANREGTSPEGESRDADVVRTTHVASASSFRLLPYEHGTDGYFVASFVRPPA